ncbi:MAG: hypothetical protein R2875_08215 [Desulfobacterales bacterium]
MAVPLPTAIPWPLPGPRLVAFLDKLFEENPECPLWAHHVAWAGDRD